MHSVVNGFNVKSCLYWVWMEEAMLLLLPVVRGCRSEWLRDSMRFGVGCLNLKTQIESSRKGVEGRRTKNGVENCNAILKLHRGS